MEQIKLKNLNQEEIRQLLPENLILLGFRGSIAHNMYCPSSDPDSIDDKDIMGVFVGSINNYLGFDKQEHKDTFIGEWDAVSYEIRKFVRLLLKSNPNVLSLLWVNDKHIIYEDELGKLLRDNKQIFVSKAAYHSFNGYAYSQFKRMTQFHYQGYMGDKRKRLVEKFGYDVKNGAHLIRLLRMGIEFLTDGELHVERADAEQLLEIKRGKWSLDKVKTEADRLFKLAEEAYIRSPLPAKPDRQKAEDLVVEIISRYHNLRKL